MYVPTVLHVALATAQCVHFIDMSCTVQVYCRFGLTFMEFVKASCGDWCLLLP